MANLNAVRSAEIQIHLLEDDGAIPNNSKLPLLIYRSALHFGDHEPAGLCEGVFAVHGWDGAWRDGIYEFPHYHSTAHEVLGIARGRVRVRLGGARGIEASIEAGDVIVIPAGVGHQNLGSSPDLLVVGAYPRGQHWDICRGRPEERPRVLENIARVALPEDDPVYGQTGPLIGHWHKRA